jgi:transposase-like protein
VEPLDFGTRYIGSNDEIDLSKLICPTGFVTQLHHVIVPATCLLSHGISQYPPQHGKRKLALTSSRAKLSTAAEVCRNFKISRRTLFRWKACWEQTRGLQLVKKQTVPFKLNPEEPRNLLVEFDKRPGLTNSQAAALLDHRINHRTISDYLK